MLAIAFAVLIAGAAGKTAIEAPTNDAIKHIKEVFKKTNEQPSRLKKTTVMVGGESSEGTGVDVFRDGAVVKKIVVASYGEMGKALSEYYFENDRLIFHFKQVIQYDGMMTEIADGKTLKETVTEEERLYFSDGKTIRFLSFKDKIPTTDDRFAQQSSRALDAAAGYLLLAQTAAKAPQCAQWECADRQGQRCAQYTCN